MRNGPLRTAKRIKTGTRNNTPLFKQIRPAVVTAGRIFCCGVEVAGSIIRFNPIAKIGYEKKAAPKMTHISKADFIKMLSTPMVDERTELARRCFIFASLTSLSYIDVKKLYPHHISENSDGRKFIRKEREKTGVEFFVPLHPIAEKIPIKKL